MTLAGPARDQADAVLAVLDRALEPGVLLGASVYGSAVAGGLRPDSDLDLFGVLGRRLTDAEKRSLIDGLMPISNRATRPAGWRPVELTLVVQDDVRPWRYPPRLDLQYGEWLREAFAGGDLAPWPASNPDVAVLLTMVRESAVTLTGPPARQLVDAVPRGDLVRAMLDELPSLLADLAADTRNVLLTLSRVWTTVATAEIRSKDAAADWALGRLPEAHRPVLELARSAYLGVADDASYDVDAVNAHATWVAAEIRRCAWVGGAGASAGRALPPRDASV